MSARPILAPVLVILMSARADAQLAQLGQPASDCPPGLMPAPAALASPLGGLTSPTGALASAARKKILGSKEARDAKVDSAPPKPKCLTPEEYTAEMKAQQSAAIKGAATAALSATPVGMAMAGAKVAAPVAGKVKGALASRFRRGPSKENMIKGLATGRLEVEDVSFDAGSDSPKRSSDKSLAALTDALKETEGSFIVKVTSESNGTAAADPQLAQRRAALITAKLIQAGVPADRVTAAPLTITTSWDSGPPRKADARLELVSASPPAAAKQ